MVVEKDVHDIVKGGSHSMVRRACWLYDFVNFRQQSQTLRQCKYFYNTSDASNQLGQGDVFVISAGGSVPRDGVMPPGIGPKLPAPPLAFDHSLLSCISSVTPHWVMAALGIGIGGSGAASELGCIQDLHARMELRPRAWRFFIADGASTNRGCEMGIPERAMQEDALLLVIYIWCFPHLLNLCLCEMSSAIAELDIDIFAEAHRLTAYLRINRAEVRQLLEETLTEGDSTSHIAVGEKGRFCSFTAPLQDVKDRWEHLQRAAARMGEKHAAAATVKNSEKRQQKRKLEEMAKDKQLEEMAKEKQQKVSGKDAAQGAEPRRSTRASRYTKSMACDAFADELEAVDVRRHYEQQVAAHDQQRWKKIQKAMEEEHCGTVAPEELIQPPLDDIKAVLKIPKQKR